MAKKKREKLITNGFYHYADINIKRAIEEEEIEKVDMTEMFYEELNKIIEHGELINMNINAPPTSGKSLTAMAIANTVMKKHFGRKLGIKDIDRDQQEFSQIMRNAEIKNTIRVIDEWNELESTGENSTTEQALYDYFSDVMAQRHVNKISCSPTNSPDKNALIFLEVVSTDKVKKINYCKLYYKMYTVGMEVRQLIGIVAVDVSEILEEEWYKEYRRRKFEKMDLILKEGIFRPRVLNYAQTIMKVEKRIRKLTKVPNLMNMNIVRNYVRMETREAKIPQSIVGEELASREVMGILDLWKAYYKLMKQNNVAKKKLNKAIESKIPEEIEVKKIEMRTTTEMIKEISESINIQLKELEHYDRIHKKYNKVLK